jgi:hypothetical protein
MNNNIVLIFNAPYGGISMPPSQKVDSLSKVFSDLGALLVGIHD